MLRGGWKGGGEIGVVRGDVGSGGRGAERNLEAEKN